jgi:hypothetical protein
MGDEPELHDLHSGDLVGDGRWTVRSWRVAVVLRFVSPSKPEGSRVIVQWGGSDWPATIVQEDGPSYLVRWDDGSAPTWIDANQIRGFAPFARVAGHSLFCLLIATLGGMTAVWLLRERANDVKQNAAPIHPTETNRSTSDVPSHPNRIP